MRCLHAEKGRGMVSSEPALARPSLLFFFFLFLQLTTVANASLPPRLASVGGGARPGIFLSKPRLSACKNSTQGPFRTAPAAFVGLSNSAASGRQKAEQREEPTCKEEADEEKGTPHLLAFVGEGCKYCERMAGSLRLVEEQTGERVLRLEVWRNALNFELLQRLDRGRCGGLPFFINLKSLRFVCGATSPRNLLHWAVGLPCNPHEPPPPSQEELDAAQRSTGPVARLLRSVDRLRRKSQETVRQQLEQELLNAVHATGK